MNSKWGNVVSITQFSHKQNKGLFVSRQTRDCHMTSLSKVKEGYCEDRSDQHFVCEIAVSQKMFTDLAPEPEKGAYEQLNVDIVIFMPLL
ncbi:hypothetical protein [Klebsiella pneumoniae]|uniref:hypothetical protein n=1 Tax=Klebsiella pneumoniae TaxID=573 RepID=UPI001F1AD94A|nr:hypothetical protein [Klebsiella pneumoniae]